ncbi:hypothetical protein EPN81_00570 [Patescibacteria group bacterium]|nr:MAG: hypothetical protein EPN81_00570 [Patescibacteria group bacterium]
MTLWITFMHPLQSVLIEMARFHKLDGRSYRQIASDIHAEHGSQAKYHLDHLLKDGIVVKKKDGTFVVAEDAKRKPLPKAVAFKQIPLLGAANCGDATMIAEDRVEQFLPVSSNIIKRDAGKWFALRAVGNSMNEAKVEGLTIEDGDYVLVDGSDKQPNDKDIVVSIIDGLANIKMFYHDQKNKQITLISRSTEEHPPILIHKKDAGVYLIAGKVKHVIKKPKMNWQA